jgi:hypothetical protein
LNSRRLIICLAYFSRYGYFTLMVVVLWILKIFGITGDIISYTLFGMLNLYGIYLLVGLRLKFKHLYCAMQNAYHQKMTPYYSFDFTFEMGRDLKFICCFFIVLGFIGIVAIYYNL